MQKLIASILFLIFSLNVLGQYNVSNSCCNTSNTSQSVSKKMDCKPKCCTKNNKQKTKSTTHKCCIILQLHQTSYAVENKINVKQGVNKNVTQTITECYSFQNLFEKYKQEKPSYQSEFYNLFSPKLFIQHCSYLI